MTVTVRALAQSQPVLDEDIRQDIGNDPEDHQQRRRFADIGILVKFEIGAHLEHQQSVSRTALRHRIDDVELLDRIEEPEQGGGRWLQVRLPDDRSGWLQLGDVADVPELRKQCGASASKPAVLPLLYKPTAAELSAAEKEANCLVRPSKKSSDLLAVIDETMKDRSKGIASNCPTAK